MSSCKNWWFLTMLRVEESQKENTSVKHFPKTSVEAVHSKTKVSENCCNFSFHFSLIGSVFNNGQQNNFLIEPSVLDWIARILCWIVMFLEFPLLYIFIFSVRLLVLFSCFFDRHTGSYLHIILISYLRFFFFNSSSIK